jgi:tetratricopeptide (TPR) repeat protein
VYVQRFRQLAVATVTLVLGMVALSCSNPAQAEIDRGAELASTGRNDEAIAAYRAALELDPDNAEALTGRGCALSQTDVAAAIADLDRAIELDPKSLDGYRCRAGARRIKGDLDAALADATKALELDPSDAAAHVAFANILDDMGRTSEAVPEYDKAIELATNAPAGEGQRRLLANAYNQRSIARGRLDDDAGAAADLDKAIELDPEYGPAYANRAMTALYAGDCKKAIEDATKAIELEPNFPTAYGARALCLADAGDLDGALADASRAIDLGRNDMYAYYTRGLVYAERGDEAKATADLRKAIELAPTTDAADEIRTLMAQYGLD